MTRKFRAALMLWLALVLGGAVTLAVSSPAQAAPPYSVTPPAAGNIPGAWTLRIYNHAEWPSAPSQYDFNLLSFMAPGSGNQYTTCVNIGGAWNDATLSAFMNATGYVTLYRDAGCTGGAVATPNCLGSCLEQGKTCDWDWYTVKNSRYGPWAGGTTPPDWSCTYGHVWNASSWAWHQ